MIVADGFDEFTANSDPKAKREHKRALVLHRRPVANESGRRRGLDDADRAAGARCRAYHDRQIVVLPPAEGLRWLDPAVLAREVLKKLPAGSLDVEQVG
jgi:hypothetical protein